MGHDAIKLELMHWLSKLDDDSVLNYLKVIKDSSENQNDWWHDLSDEQKSGVSRGLNDVDNGRFHSHEDVKIKYGL
jgi:predicted transcriptional regulator